MTGALQRQSSIFFTPLASQVSLIKDDLLDPLDRLLEDDELVRLVSSRLDRRRPRSSRTGRPGIAPDRLLRCCVLKHLKGWSFRELERELRCNLLYRRFTRFDDDLTPDFTTFSRNFALLGDTVVKAIQQRTVGQAREEHVVTGEKARTDTTVVETNIHHPTDSRQLGDGIRVLTRVMAQISEQCVVGAVVVVDHARAVKRRLLEISRAAKSKTDASRERMKESYRKLLVITRRVSRKADGLVDGLKSGALRLVGSALKAALSVGRLLQFKPLVEKVIAQTEARVFGGDRHVGDKILSLFEPHTQVICKGKAHKPAEFGRLVRLDEVEGCIISNYEILEGNRTDSDSLLPAIEQHVSTFGKPPKMITADRGYFSARNEKEAGALGVRKVAVPAPGRLSKSRAAHQKERWFRRALRWRAGVEGRIGTLKHRFGMLRATYKEESGFERYVGWSIITHNLVSIARNLTRRRLS